MNLINSILILFISLSFIFGENMKKYENIIELADHFYEQKKFDFAIIEYERANLLYPDKSMFFSIKEKIAECYYKKGFFIESIKVHKSILAIEENYFNSIFNISHAYQMLNQYKESNSFLKKYSNNLSKSKLDTLKILKFYNYFALMKIDSAKIILQNISDKKLEKIVNRNMRVLNEYEQKKFKNPKSAKLLNILFPGLGYLYIGLPETALATFLVESLFLYSTIMTYQNNYSIGTLFGALFFSGFYFGSAYGAEEFAIRKKKEILLNYLNLLNFDIK